MKKTNKDKFANLRAQMWNQLRMRCWNTYKAITQGEVVGFTEDDLISFSSEMDECDELLAELSRPKRLLNDNGKIQVESKKAMKARQVDSPNRGDSAVMNLAFIPDLDTEEEVEDLDFDSFY